MAVYVTGLRSARRVWTNSIIQVWARKRIGGTGSRSLLLLDSHEAADSLVPETLFPLEFSDVCARDGDLAAARLGVSEIEIGHKGKESSLVAWIGAIDLLGLEWTEESGCIPLLMAHASS
jgi:hypothetical protein